ncbi:MAG: HDIG domain-containing protein [Muribaculaceae bacterium]|nr:HDIG domain-containing protein [Muribaculaceae bacterium]
MKFPDNPLLKRLLTALAATIIMVWFYPHARLHQYLYEQDRPWNYNQLIAPFDIPIHPDSLTVQSIRDTLQKRFIPIYSVYPAVVDSIVNELPAGHYRNQVAAIIRAEYAKGVVDPTVMAEIRDGKLPKIRILRRNILSESSTASLISPREVYLALDHGASDQAMRQYIADAKLQQILRPSLIFNELECKRYYDNEFQTLTADRGVIMQGQAIINKGDIISAQDYTNLRTYEAMLAARASRTSHTDLLTLLGQFLYVGILVAVMMGYLAFIVPKVYRNFKAVLFINLLLVVFFLFSAGLNAFLIGGVYIVPLVIVPIMVGVFFDGRTALFTATVLTLIIAPIVSFAMEFIFLEFIAVGVAIYSLRQLSTRSELLRTAVLVSLAYVLGYLAVELLMNGSLSGFSWRMVVYLGANAVMVSMAYILMFPIEKYFGFLSPVTLVELSDTNQPLLRELSDKCPGTFQHAMSVSNLASDAARAMGANEQLVRAGALYHDIGKIDNPAFFTENQHGVNPHDTLTPEQSARIVIGHVTDGLRRADRAGLPAAISDFIREHHGAGKAKYFYFQAAKSSPDGVCPNPEAFTYPGPNPRSRETSLLMMADAVEAASRSLKTYTKESITDLVNKIVDGQIADHLHDNSTLEFRDIRLIKQAFIKRLMTIYHTRISYPDGK